MPYAGSLALRLIGAEELICRTEAFRAHCCAANVEQAKSKVYCGEITLEDVLAMLQGGTLEVARPCAVIGVQSHSYEPIGQGSSYEMGSSGAIWVLFIDNPETAKDHKISLLAFTDWMSLVMDQASKMFGQDVGASDYTLWPFQRAHMFFEPYRPDIADRQTDDYWLGGYLLFDSINGGG